MQSCVLLTFLKATEDRADPGSLVVDEEYYHDCTLRHAIVHRLELLALCGQNCHRRSLSLRCLRVFHNLAEGLATAVRKMLEEPSKTPLLA